MNHVTDLKLRESECDREPIHVPGAVQPHGAVIAVDPATWRTTHASENLHLFLGRTAPEALGQPLAELLGEAPLRDLLRQIQADFGQRVPTRINGIRSGDELLLLPHATPDGTICIDVLPEPDQGNRPSLLQQAQAILEALRLAQTSTGLCRIAVNSVRRATGFDRVMAYRFEEDGSGEVIAEDVTPGAQPFLGLRYPASDIPQQARRTYLLQRVRTIPDVNAAPAALLAAASRHPTELDLSASAVRAVSPVHLLYLRNMGVTATAVVSLIVGGRLWGMLVCHHDVPRLVAHDERVLFDLVGQLMACMLGTMAERDRMVERLVRKQALERIGKALAMAQRDPAASLAECSADLLALVQADGVVLSIDGRSVTFGSTPAAPTARAIRQLLKATIPGELAATASLEAEMDPSRKLDGFAGALVLSLPSSPDSDILWLRHELRSTVTWAGNPGKVPDPLTGKLTPRDSFAAWAEEVRGRSAPWSQAELDIARDLGRMIDEAQVRRADELQLARLRDSDPLTGLANRRQLEDQLTNAALAGHGAIFAYLDIDRFRGVNDALGRTAGDALLQQVANRLRVASRPNELVVRLGADEFGVLSLDASANQVAFRSRIAGILGQTFEVAGQRLQIHGSIGIATAASPNADLRDLPRLAEAAMRDSRLQGGNSTSLHAPSVSHDAAHHLSVEQALDEALRSDRSQFQLAFQPIVDARTGLLRSWEALLRWTHPGLGSVSPGVFIPIAERTGLIAAIGDLVLDRSLRILAEIPLRAAERNVYVSVNVSPLQLLQAGFPETLRAQRHELGIEPGRLCIEITEGVFTDEYAKAAIGSIRDQGVIVAMDDFGIGYSALSSLQRLPADVAKLDRSFLPDGAALTPDRVAFLGAVVALARTAGMAVVLEGVETEEQLNAAIAVGVDGIQGYFLSRPMSVEAAVAVSCQDPCQRPWSRHFASMRKAQAPAEGQAPAAE